MTDLDHTDRITNVWIDADGGPFVRSAQEDRERAMKARERIIAARRGGEEKTK